MKRFSGVLTICVMIAVWEIVVRLFHIPVYFLPAPSLVAKSLYQGLIADGFIGRRSFYPHIWKTMFSTLSGFVLGSSLGILLAVLITESSLLERVISPALSGFQSLPKVALAPLFVIWFGYGDMSRVLLTTALVFFPVMVNTKSGLKDVDVDRVMLVRALNGSRWQILRFIKIPSALPYLFSGLEVGVVYALIGAIVAELMAGSKGLGALLLESQSSLNISGVFAILVLLAVFGALLSRLVSWVESKLLFWTSTKRIAL